MPTLKQTYADSDGLSALTLALSMARGLDEVMAVVRGRARALIGCDGVTFVLRDDDKCFYADEDAISPLWKGQRFPLENCISGWAMLNRQPVVIEDIYLDERIPHAAYRPTFVKSLAMMPVRQDDPVGAIGAYWSKTYQPNDAQMATLRHIANSAAVAITNARLMSELVDAREAAIKAREGIILAMSALAETRDDDTAAHIYRTQHYVRHLADAARKCAASMPMNVDPGDRRSHLQVGTAARHRQGRHSRSHPVEAGPARSTRKWRRCAPTQSSAGRRSPRPSVTPGPNRHSSRWPRRSPTPITSAGTGRVTLAV